MSEQGGRAAGPRCIAIVGPQSSGKTTLLESLLARDGARERQGSVSQRTALGDSAPHAREMDMGVQLNVATAAYLGDEYTFLDCPGSIEFAQDMHNVLPVVDAALVVCEADPKKVPALQLILKALEARGVPRFLFVNKIDRSEARLRETLARLQPASAVPLVLRQIPIWEGEVVTGYIDLALERAHVYREHAASEVVDMSREDQAREVEARFSMLEALADYDDALMEALLEDMEPPRDRVFDDLRREVREGHIVPVLIGSAEHGNGMVRVFKALRHDAPGIAQTRARLGLEEGGAGPLVHVVKTVHAGHGGKLSLARILAGSVAEGGELKRAGGAGERVGGIFRLMGEETTRRERAEAGETVALGRLEGVATGETLTGEGVSAPDLAPPAPPHAVYALALSARERKDEVKLTAALAKLIEEDPSLLLEQDADLHEMRLRGQGEMHLRANLAKLKTRFGVEVAAGPPRIGYRETIRAGAERRGRHKKQSGGHGQFGDVVLEIAPLGRGEGFHFSDTISGGVVPKHYIPAVEAGAREALARGPLGFPVVDVALVLKDGSYHSVDSSEQAFRMAGALAVREALPECRPVLLEPVMEVEITVPGEATARINALVAGRRGQLLGLAARPDWENWDVVRAYMPQAEIRDLIVEIRSATAGIGTFEARFDHMAELTGKAAEQAQAA